MIETRSPGRTVVRINARMESKSSFARKLASVIGSMKMMMVRGGVFASATAAGGGAADAGWPGSTLTVAAEAAAVSSEKFVIGWSLPSSRTSKSLAVRPVTRLPALSVT
jgi:hypothetical protein